jgi:hypothetical protein
MPKGGDDGETPEIETDMANSEYFGAKQSAMPTGRALKITRFHRVGRPPSRTKIAG